MRKTSVLFFSLLVFAMATRACTIFMANNGRHVWIGNNEDENPNTLYRLWYEPAAQQAYGYMLWTELTTDREINKIIYKNPQGGMNTQGLFMDYTAIDSIPAFRDPIKKDREEEIVTDLLKYCRTVNEALRFISRFNLVRLTNAQLFIGDANGNYAIVHGSYVVRKSTRNFALTNYCVDNGYYEACWRRDVATKYLAKGNAYHLSGIVNILQKSTQKPPSNLVSNYSMAVDLINKTIHLFYKGDFGTSRTIALAKELKKGRHYRDMVSYFPLSLTDTLQQAYKAGGVNALIHTYRELYMGFPKKYNFKNNDAINLGIEMIAGNKTKDAIRYLSTLRRMAPKKTAINIWLGVAYWRNDEPAKSKACFATVLKARPHDYVATLFGRQEKQKVWFKLQDFEGASKVLLLGDFSDWKPIPMQKRKGLWTCTLALPKGAYRYKFRVNDIYLADQVNLLHGGNGADIYSILYVW